MFYYQTFFLLQICFLLDCSCIKYVGKKSGVTVLVSPQTATKGGHGFEIARQVGSALFNICRKALGHLMKFTQRSIPYRFGLAG